MRSWLTLFTPPPSTYASKKKRTTVTWCVRRYISVSFSIFHFGKIFRGSSVEIQKSCFQPRYQFNNLCVFFLLHTWQFVNYRSDSVPSSRDYETVFIVPGPPENTKHRKKINNHKNATHKLEQIAFIYPYILNLSTKMHFYVYWVLCHRIFVLCLCVVVFFLFGLCFRIHSDCEKKRPNEYIYSREHRVLLSWSRMV